jgi:2-methylisocitrate lyase-like PEP mutase family enzyme
VMGLGGAGFSVEEVAEAGVKRISLGSAFSRAALGAFLRAAREVREHGTFTFARAAASFADLDPFMLGRDL